MIPVSSIALPDYLSDLPSDKIKIAQNLDSEFEKLGRKTAQLIIKQGQILIEMKALLGHGKFGSWLEAKSLSSDSADRWMAVAREFGDEPQTADLFVPTVLYLLAAPSTSQAAKEEIIQLAQSGAVVDLATARQIRQAHQTSGGSGGSSTSKRGSGRATQTPEHRFEDVSALYSGLPSARFYQRGSEFVVEVPGKTKIYASPDGAYADFQAFQARLGTAPKRCSGCQYYEQQSEGWFCSKFSRSYTSDENPATNCDRYAAKPVEVEAAATITVPAVPEIERIEAEIDLAQLRKICALNSVNSLLQGFVRGIFDWGDRKWVCVGSGDDFALACEVVPEAAYTGEIFEPESHGYGTPDHYYTGRLIIHNDEHGQRWVTTHRRLRLTLPAVIQPKVIVYLKQGQGSATVGIANISVRLPSGEMLHFQSNEILVE